MVPRTLHTDTHKFTKVNKELYTLVLQNEAGSSICLMHCIKDKCTIFANIFEDFYFFTSEDKWTLCLGPCRDRKLSLTPPVNLRKEVLLWLVWFHSSDWLPVLRGESPESPSMALSPSSVPAREGARQAVPGGGLANCLACFFLSHKGEYTNIGNLSLGLGQGEKRQGWHRNTPRLPLGLYLRLSERCW